MFEASMHDDRKKTPTMRNWRPMTFEEMLAVAQRSRQYIRLGDGTVGQVTITSIKRWKTRPRDIDFRAQYGLYAHFVFSVRDGKMSDETVAFLVEVEDKNV